MSKFRRDRYVEPVVDSADAAAPHLFVADIQSGQLDRCVAWLVAARVLQVQAGMVELAREAGVPEAELPIMPCHPMLLVAHAERDLHARSFDYDTASTVSALVMLSAIECVALLPAPLIAQHVRPARATHVRLRIGGRDDGPGPASDRVSARPRLDAGRTAHVVARGCRDGDADQRCGFASKSPPDVSATWMLSFLLAWHALGGRAGSVFDQTAPITGLPLPAYATPLGPLEGTLGGAAVLRRHRDFCDACRILQSASLLWVTLTSQSSPSTTATHAACPSPASSARPRRRRSATWRIRACNGCARPVHRSPRVCTGQRSVTSTPTPGVVSPRSCPSSLSVRPSRRADAQTIYALAQHNAQGYLLEAASLGIELVETFVEACELAKRPGVVDRHTISALVELLRYILPRAFELLSDLDESGAEACSAERIDRVASALLDIRDEIGSPVPDGGEDKAYADRYGAAHSLQIVRSRAWA